MRRAFSLTEVVVAASLVALCLLVYLGVAGQSMREATRERSQIIADELLYNTVEEILGCRYGSPDHWWKTGAAGALQDPTTRKVSLPTVIEGRAVAADYAIRVEAAPERQGNGSFFGQSKGQENHDVVKITVRWREGSGLSSAGQDKVKSAYLTVWRSSDDV